MRNLTASIARLILYAIWSSDMSAAYAPEVTFPELFKNPAKYDRKRVIINGIADAGGGLLWVWRDPKAWQDLKACLKTRGQVCDDTGAIFVVYDTPPRAKVGLYDHVNAHHVRATGIIDTRIRGHLGGDPFSMVLEHLEVLPGPRLREFIPILGFFRNDSGMTIKLETEFGNEGMFTDGIRSGQVIGAGKIGKGTVIVKTMKDVVFAKAQMIPPRLFDPYYDRPAKAYYFRITNHSIEPVYPKDAIGWNKGYTGDRD
jgi:hypothetical protein